MASRSLLAAMIAPVRVDEFLRGAWETPVFSHGSVRRLAMLTAVPELASVHALIAASQASKNLIAWSPRPGDIASDGRIAPRHAERRYADGYTLYFHGVEDHVPALREIVAGLDADLGLRPGSTSCLAFASRVGSGAKAHFDPNFVFNVQLAGVKHWELAPGRVAHPLVPSIAGVADDSGRPAEMPEPRWKVTARPGSVVFLPHGTWHRTLASEESFAVAFVVDAKPWGALVTDLVWDALAADSDERQLDVLLTHRTPRALLRRRLAATGAKIAAILARLEATALLSEVPDYDAVYEVPRALTVALRDTRGGRVEVAVRAGATTERVEIDAELAAVLRWVIAHRPRFTLRTALVERGDREARLVVAGIERLAEAGLVHRARPRR